MIVVCCESLGGRLPRTLFPHHHSPTIVDLVAHRFLSAGWNLHKELKCAAIELFEGIGILDEVPVRPAIEMLDEAYFNRVAFVIAHLDFKRFVKPPRIEVCPVIRADAFPGHVEGVAGIEADGLVFGGVVDVILARELELTIIVAPIETHASFWKGHAEMILGAVFELLHDPNFGIGENAITFLLANALHRPALIILIDSESIVDIDGLGLDSGGPDHFYLLGFAIVESCEVLEGVEMIFIESLFCYRWTKLASTHSKPRGTQTSPHHHLPWRRSLVHIACHQLEARIAKGFATLIVEGHPADELEHIGFRRRNHVITCPPVHAAGHIAELRRDSTRLVG